MIFELDSREHVMAFPCAICKKNTQPADVCHDVCGLYGINGMESSDLKNDVQKLIDGFRQHPDQKEPL